jgi:hypothetical protein
MVVRKKKRHRLGTSSTSSMHAAAFRLADLAGQQVQASGRSIRSLSRYTVDVTKPFRSLRGFERYQDLSAIDRQNLVSRLERDETQVVKYLAEARMPTGQTNA